MLNIGKRKWASSFCLASSFGGAFFSAPFNNVAADNEFLQSDLFKILVSTVFKYKVDHFHNNNKSMDSIIDANMKAKCSKESTFADVLFANAFKETYKRMNKDKYFENMFFDKSKDDLEKTKILSLDEKYPWENLDSLFSKIKELKSQGLDTLIYWYAISDFKGTCATVRSHVLGLPEISVILKSKNKWLCEEIEKTRRIEENALKLKLAIDSIIKEDTDSKILDFLRTRTYKDMFLNSKGEYNQEKFGAYMKYIGEFCGRIKNGEFDENLSVDEKNNLLFCESLANTFLKIISISHNKMPKNKQDNRFKSESPLALGLLSNSEKETLIFDILKCSEIFIGRKFLTKDYIAKAIEEIAKSFKPEDSKKLFSKIFYNLEHMFKEYVSSKEDTFSLFNILIKNLKGEKQEQLIFEIIKRLDCSPEKKDMYLSKFLLCAVKGLGKEQRKNLFKYILSRLYIFSNSDNSERVWVFSILGHLVSDFSKEEKQSFFFHIVERADELLRKNNKGEYVDADNILKALEILFDEKTIDAVIDVFLFFVDKRNQNFIWSSACDPLAKLSVSNDSIIKFFKFHLDALKITLKEDVSDWICNLVQVNSGRNGKNGIRFEKQ